MYGNALQSELDGAKGKNEKAIQRNRESILRRWFPEARAERKFKDPFGKR